MRGPRTSSTRCVAVVGLTRIELVTSSLSGMRSTRVGCPTLVRQGKCRFDALSGPSTAFVEHVSATSP